VDISAIFEFIADNPPMALIVGAILMVTLSVLTAPFDPATTEFLRNMSIWLFIGGGLLNVLWLFLRRR